MNHHFRLGSKQFEVSCDTEEGVLTLTQDSKLKKSVPIADIFAVRCEGDTWTVQYVRRTTDKWLPEILTFTTTETGICEQWSKYVQDAMQPFGKDRPKRLLIFINPDGGNKEGVKNYNKKAKPLFTAAGISDQVIVTEDVDHIGRVLPDYDLTSVDGIVVVGGDGTFMHVAAALMKRLMSDAGKDPDDPEEELVKSQVKLGLLPGGSGQGLVKMFSGFPVIPSYVTSTLQIIFGVTISGNLTSVHHNDKLVYYSTLQCCFGALGIVLEKCESRRWMGRARYLSAFGSMLLPLNQPYEVKFSVLVDKDESTDGTNEEWVTSTGAFKGIDCFCFKCPASNSTVRCHNYTVDRLSASIVDESAGPGTYLKMIYRFATYKDNWFQDPHITKYDAKAFKLELPPPTVGNKDYHVLNIDGDVFKVGGGLLQGRLYNDVFKVFGTGVPQQSDVE